MLKDNILESVNIITRKHQQKIDKLPFQLQGKLEIFGHKKGKLFYYDNGENTVTVWAKHATMHLLTGESFGSWDNLPPKDAYCQRLFDSGTYGLAYAHKITGNPGEGTNVEGTMISGQQYYSTNISPDFNINARWTESSINAQTTDGDKSDSDDSLSLPFFPTKMLFGTGFEFTGWNSGSNPVSSYPAYQSVYSGQGWDAASFDGPYGAYDTLQNSRNVYSNVWNGTSLTQTRTMNDIYAAALSTPTINDTDFAITGAIKNGVYQIGDASNTLGYIPGTFANSQRWWPSTDPDDPDWKTYWTGGNEFLKKQWAGVGDPCFIYSRRESRFHQTGSEVALSNDSYLENKVTFTAVMPEQTGANAGIFYPYNGYLLKEAGLFCDARMLLGNSEPTGGVGDEHTSEQENYLKMNHGILFAKRYIAPIQKSHDVSITARWTIYL